MRRRLKAILTVLVCLAPVPAGASARRVPDGPGRALQANGHSEAPPAVPTDVKPGPAGPTRVQAPINDRVTPLAAF